MGLYLHLAWRNLWRNSRRTLISVTSIVFAVLLALAMRSMQNGTYDSMIQSAVGLFLGYVQVHAEGYWEKRSLDESVELTNARLLSFDSLSRVTRVVPRLESFVLLSKDSSTKVAQVVGIDPRREDDMTGLARRIKAGRFLHKDDEGLLIAAGLARSLNASVGDSVVIYGQGFHGVTAAARIPVIGILKFPLPDLDHSMSYVTLQYAQWLFSAPGRVTSIAFMVGSPGDMDQVQSELKAKAGPRAEVMNWKEMMPELVQVIEADSAGGILMLLILYIVIGFGIFGTIMMMTTERSREFGVLISVGMKRWKLIAVTTLETLIISMLGALVGIIAGIPVLWYLHLHPIPLSGELAEAMLAYGMDPALPFSIESGIFFAQAGIVFGLALVCALYPLMVLRKLNPVSALRS